MLDYLVKSTTMNLFLEEIWDLVNDIVENARYVDPEPLNITYIETTPELLVVKTMLKQLVNAQSKPQGVSTKVMTKKGLMLLEDTPIICS